MKHISLAACALASSSAFALPISLEDFTFTPAISVGVTNTDPNGPGAYTGEAGQFTGAFGGGGDSLQFNLQGADADASGSSFNAFCAELGQSFLFNVAYDYTEVSGVSYFGAQKSSDLSRLFFAAQLANFGFDNVSSGALQAAVWEIIYEKSGSYDLTGGNAKIAPTDPSFASAFATVNGFLTGLGQYSDAYYEIDVLTNAAQQDFLVPVSVPEPGTWALLVAGLGVVGLVARRRKA
jgi:hypothetical protein